MWTNISVEWWQDRGSEHTPDCAQAGGWLVVVLWHGSLLPLAARLTESSENTKAAVLFVSCTTQLRLNEGVWKWCLILSIKVNEVSAQLAQSWLWLYNGSFSLCDYNMGPCLCSLLGVITHTSFALDRVHGPLHHYISVNFDANNSPQDAHRIINSMLRGLSFSLRWIKLLSSSRKRPRFFQHSRCLPNNPTQQVRQKLNCN